MKLEQKQSLVDELTIKLRSANAIYLTDFVGLNVKAMTKLRARLREQGSEYLVVKNTLAERALGNLDMPDVSAYFSGPTGLVIAPADPVGPAKVLSDFAKEHDNKPVVKAGIVERRAVEAADVVRLASLPSREQLLSLLAGALEAPMAQFAAVLQAKIDELAGVIDALREQREG
jgi:large subunit ribosomal protein L10